jgi:riboflavin kinase/FMN adenylyltransferase
MRTVRVDARVAAGWPWPAVTIGNFDGVHRGHRALVRATVAAARPRQGTAVVLTFDPHPARVLAPERAPAALSTTAQKAEALAGLGADVMAVLPFDTATAALAPEDFAREVLQGVVGARHVVVGRGFRFGRGQQGDAALLSRLGAQLGFTAEEVEPVREGAEPVSSSRVREALSRSDVALAARLLGRPYCVDGIVVEGDRRGRTLGFPTANLAPENEIVPARGVYACRCRVPPGEWHPAVVNVGVRPTFGGAATSVEAHLLDFAGELYGARVRLAFEHRLRDERRFDGPGALVAQIREDVLRARALLSNHAPGRGIVGGDPQ